MGLNLQVFPILIFTDGMGPPYFSRLANDFVPCHLNPSVYLSSVSIYHCTSVLVIPRLLLLHVGHVLVLGRGPRGLDVTRRLVILDIDCARVTHPNRVTRLLTRNVSKYTYFVRDNLVSPGRE